MSVVDMARMALAILWGGSLCGFVLLALAVASHEDGPEGLAGLIVLLVVVAVLATLAAADIFHVINWMFHVINWMWPRKA